MEISRTKLLIYALTFLGYAFSGYGTGVVENVRDAVIFAEQYLGQYLKNAVDLIRRLGDGYHVWETTDEECRYTCPSGATPVENVLYQPSPETCGSDAISLQVLGFVPVSGLRECCIKLDLCYQTCNKLKVICDDEFKHCLYNVCNRMNIITSKICKASAYLISTSMSFGCGSYFHKQKKCCYCPDEDDPVERQRIEEKRKREEKKKYDEKSKKELKKRQDDRKKQEKKKAEKEKKKHHKT